ncbi:urocortin-3 [Perognathus longimembris pacificus]|uniref:urocortin-3 n=1 Tax=Perognathus longimembris pacificus TaxID=214514 RepID=UPI00201956A4|nr:urocortin-3 [Perognathus longimembris pacificus]
MLMPAYLLLFLLLPLDGARTGLSHKVYKARPVFSCLNTALSEIRKNPLEDMPLLSKRAFYPLPSQDPASGEEEEEQERQDKAKRTFLGSGSGGAAANARYKYASQAQHRGKASQDKAKGDRRTKFTLSLDVPTNIMNILFDIAKAKNLRAKAAANAHLMAQIGRKK